MEDDDDEVATVDDGMPMMTTMILVLGCLKLMFMILTFLLACTLRILCGNLFPMAIGRGDEEDDMLDDYRAGPREALRGPAPRELSEICGP